MHPFRPTTIETPDSARKTTISLLATGRVVLATTTHTMSGGMATALVTVTTIVATEEAILVVVTWIRTLSLRGGETITQINMITSTIIAIPPRGNGDNNQFSNNQRNYSYNHNYNDNQSYN